MKSIRCGMGLGDSLYLQSVARWFVQRGEYMHIASAWPDVFLPLAHGSKVVPFRRNNIDVLAHYSLRKKFTHTDQFEDCCIQAGIKELVELKLDWTVTDSELVDRLRQRGKPIVCVQLPRNPMNRQDGFGAELLPDCGAIQRAIDSIQGRATIVQVGGGKSLYDFRGIDIDLANKTNLKQLIDVASVADSFLGYCSFLVPLAEGFDKPALFVWSRRGLSAKHPYIRQITPKKILHKDSSLHVFDDQKQISGESLLL